MPDLLDDVARQRDMVVLTASAAAGMDLLCAVERKAVDVLVVGLRDGKLPGVCSHIFIEFPELVILGIDSNCQAAVLFRYQLQSSRLEDLSTGDLVCCIRAAVRSDVA